MPWTPNPDDVEGEDLLYDDADEPTALAWTDLEKLPLDENGLPIIYLDEAEWNWLAALLEEDDNDT